VFRYETPDDLRRGSSPRGALLRRVEHPVWRSHRPRPADSSALIGYTTRRDAISVIGTPLRARRALLRQPAPPARTTRPPRRSPGHPGRQASGDCGQATALACRRSRASPNRRSPADRPYQKGAFQTPAQLSAGTRIASTLQHLAAHPSHAASAAGAEACRRATMLSRPRSPRPSRRPSPPTTLLSSPPGMGAAAAEGMSGPRPRGNWGLTWTYVRALAGGGEPLMQQSGATVAAVDGSNSWCLNAFRSQEMTNSSPCPSPPPVGGTLRSVDRAS
jgi:hypothetical protein